MFSELNEKQKEAVYAPNGPLLIVAGAGSGKTKTLTARIAYFISHRRIPPEKILAITFTNRAASEMKSRVLDILKNEGVHTKGEPHVSTFHSFGAMVLRRVCAHVGRSISFSIYDGDDSLKLVKKLLKDRNLEKKQGPGFFIREISRIKSECIPLPEIGDSIVREIYEEYEAALQKSNAFDFDDLIEKVVRVFRAHPAVLDVYQKQYRAVFVDEYQDTNMAQYYLLKLLTGAQPTITVVGDDAQSIYGFRFSDFRNFLNFEKNWPDAKIIFLEQNYRSSKNIITTSSDLIAKNTQQKKKRLWTDNEQGAPVRIIEYKDESQQADGIVQQAHQYHQNNMRVGILFRTNAQSRALEQVCVERTIPYRLFGAVRFYDRKEIRDVLSALRYAHNPLDYISLERLDKNLYKKDFIRMQQELPLRAHTHTPQQLISYFMEAVSYATYVRQEFSNFTERMENIDELLFFAGQFDSLAAFLEKVSLVDGFDTGKKKKPSRYEQAHSIDLMTIHLAKGLEFDVVFVAGVCEGSLPHQRSYFSIDELEEERRLLYVAMTRARKELSLHFFGIPSRFLFELPGDRVVFTGNMALDDEERYIEYD